MANEPFVQFFGNLTADSMLRYTQSGKAVCNFNVAINPGYYDSQGNWQTGTPIFLPCVLWRGAEVMCEYLLKGKRVNVFGTLEDNSYTDQNGNVHTAMRVNVKNVGIMPREAGENVGYSNGAGGSSGGSPVSSYPAPPQHDGGMLDSFDNPF